MNPLSRREFLGSSTGAALAAATVVEQVQAVTAPQTSSSATAGKLRVGCVGVGGRAGYLCDTFSKHPQAEIVAVADIDSRRLPEAIAKIAANQGSKPQSFTDFRQLLALPQVEALVIGTPDHWHAIPTIMACQAGKDVYVEKPDGHNMIEGKRMVEAQQKHGRIVQMGTQSRSSRHFLSAMDYIRSGKLGRCLFASAWESGKQGSIGKPADSQPPEGVDYDFWLGPAAKRPFNPARFHGNWRWWFDLGTGDLGNDGVHRLDIARWALSTAIEAQGGAPLGLPRSISASGGKWYFDDYQEWPDTLAVTYEFAGSPGCVITYEMRVSNPYKFLDEPEGAAVFGDQGYIILGNRRWRAFGPKDKLLHEESGDYDDVAHIQNFIDCVRTRQRPNADLATVGHLSSVMCHAGNIAWRVGRKIFLDPKSETFVLPDAAPDTAANALCGRAIYRAPWLLPEV